MDLYSAVVTTVPFLLLALVIDLRTGPPRLPRWIVLVAAISAYVAFMFAMFGLISEFDGLLLRLPAGLGLFLAGGVLLGAMAYGAMPD